MDKAISNMFLLSECPLSPSFLSVYPCIHVIEAESEAERASKPLIKSGWFAFAEKNISTDF